MPKKKKNKQESKYVAIYHCKGLDEAGIRLLKERLKSLSSKMELVTIPFAEENRLEIVEIK